MTVPVSHIRSAGLSGSHVATTGGAQVVTRIQRGLLQVAGGAGPAGVTAALGGGGDGGTTIPRGRTDLSKSVLSTSGDLNQAKTTVRYGASRAVARMARTDLTPREKEKQKFLSSSPVRRRYAHGETREIDDHAAREAEEDFLSATLRQVAIGGSGEGEQGEEEGEAKEAEDGEDVEDTGIEDADKGKDKGGKDGEEEKADGAVQDDGEQDDDAGEEVGDEVRQEEVRQVDQEQEAAADADRINAASLSALDLLYDRRDVAVDEQVEIAASSAQSSPSVASPAGTTAKPASPEMGIWLSTYVRSVCPPSLLPFRSYILTITLAGRCKITPSARRGKGMQSWPPPAPPLSTRRKRTCPSSRASRVVMLRGSWW